MKKRYQAGILAAAISLSITAMAFANGSAGTGMASGGGSSSRPNKIGSSNYGSAGGGSGTMSGNSGAGSSVTFSDNFGTSISDNQIAQVNEGLSTIQSLPSDVDLTGYNPLVRIQEMQTSIPAGSQAQVDIYVPNLVGGLNNIQILIQNPNTGKWELVAPASVNTDTKTVTVSLSYAGPMTVVYKN